MPSAERVSASCRPSTPGRESTIITRNEPRLVCCAATRMLSTKEDLVCRRVTEAFRSDRHSSRTTPTGGYRKTSTTCGQVWFCLCGAFHNVHALPRELQCNKSRHEPKHTTNLPYVRMTSPSLILVMAFLAISFAARVIRVLMNSLILSMMLAFASSSGREGGDLAIIFLRAFQVSIKSSPHRPSVEFLNEAPYHLQIRSLLNTAPNERIPDLRQTAGA